MSEETSLGAMLREARERRGETLEQAHQQTAISPVLLQELESGEFQVEPVYARLAAANYASYLGLDSKEVATRFDLQFGRPDFPSPTRTYLRHFGPPNFLSAALNSILSRRTPPFWKTGAAAAAIALAVLLAIFFSGEPEEPSPPPVEAAEVPPTLPLQEESEPAAAALQEESEPAAAALQEESEPASAALQEESGPAAAALQEESGPAAAALQEESEPVAAALQEGSGPAATALQEEPVSATEDEGVATDLAPPLVLRAEAVDSTWVRVRWDGGTGSAEEIIPGGESRQWEAADNFVVFAGRAHGVRFYLQGQLLGEGRLGDPTQVLRFRASLDEVVLLGKDLTPLSPSTANPGGTPSP